MQPIAENPLTPLTYIPSKAAKKRGVRLKASAASTKRQPYHVVTTRTMHCLRPWLAPLRMQSYRNWSYNNSQGTWKKHYLICLKQTNRYSSIQSIGDLLNRL
ncbi:hypothetical protein O181_049174 [Austropuccinia psidii MF-1]|uniref:Uncharacterized protein n=1 Tax=Austropuccinia psidii MF-1 TaxID=1389203 RepID=A0A9Q3DUE3_9BASI|nr:hypothetical protein [Austropuccinia psidii MF-1]